MRKLNFDKLITAELFNTAIDDFFVYKKEIKIFGIVFREAGIYGCLGNSKCKSENRYVKDGMVYNKPYVYMKFQSDVTEYIYFDTYDEAREFFNSLPGNHREKSYGYKL